MSYYAMYHSLIALMFKCVIKCENHTANILLLKELFNENGLYKIILNAKEERIDKQYYVDFEVTKKDVDELILKAQEFTTKIKLKIENLTNNEIEAVRKRLRSILK